jgi:hypothetical protein
LIKYDMCRPEGLGESPLDSQYTFKINEGQKAKIGPFPAEYQWK